MKLAIFGAGGRMGRTITKLASEAADISIVGAIDHHGADTIGRDVGELAGTGNLGVEVSADIGSSLLGADVLIDFSTASAFGGMLRAAASARVGVVSGTTRISDDDRALLQKVSASVPVMWAPNMSVGVQLLAELVARSVAALGLSYDVEVVEAHHNRKIDAPSGTATMLVKSAQSARSALTPVHGRQGQPGARKADEIGVHALRGGGVIGDHAVHLIGPYDRIEINHRAMQRELFGEGALRAARFVAAQSPGLYQMADVLTQ